MMFKRAKKVSGGYNIPLQEPLRFTLSLFCPFGIDVESDWKWSMKFYVPIKSESTNKGDIECYNFLVEMQHLESQIQSYLKHQFPSTYKDYFVVQTFLQAISDNQEVWIKKEEEEDNFGCFFRAKIPIKKGIAATKFTGNSKWETQRTLVPDDIKGKTRVVIDIECDGWWIIDNKVGYTMILLHVREELQSK